MIDARIAIAHNTEQALKSRKLTVRKKANRAVENNAMKVEALHALKQENEQMIVVSEAERFANALMEIEYSEDDL